uniref:Uncharacterized protein n=1 Tax=Avena sativa TaxID=4498 RepID=A0ACD5Y6W0_AVESA
MPHGGWVGSVSSLPGAPCSPGSLSRPAPSIAPLEDLPRCRLPSVRRVRLVRPRRRRGAAGATTFRRRTCRARVCVNVSSILVLMRSFSSVPDQAISFALCIYRASLTSSIAIIFGLCVHRSRQTPAHYSAPGRVRRQCNMLSAATRAAGVVARSLVAAVVGAAGTVIGAMVGLLRVFVEENGLLQGALVGAVTGALVSVELADSLLGIWTCEDCPMDARVKRTRLVLRSFAAGRLLRGSVFPAISGALDAQMDALRYQSHHYSAGARDDHQFEPSSAVMAARKAAVESLPATTLTKETAEQTTCPICLHEFQAGDSARRLPACRHVFHLACIDSWLLWKPQCPMCRHAVY